VFYKRDLDKVNFPRNMLPRTEHHSIQHVLFGTNIVESYGVL